MASITPPPSLLTRETLGVTERVEDPQNEYNGDETVEGDVGQKRLKGVPSITQSWGVLTQASPLPKTERYL